MVPRLRGLRYDCDMSVALSSMVKAVVRLQHTLISNFLEIYKRYSLKDWMEIEAQPCPRRVLLDSVTAYSPLGALSEGRFYFGLSMLAS